ncbi:MAG: hypothetical protein CL862_12550 [Cyanobium sp. NAT70]|nr:hypothetical protein [Cyanobium sp. NAT70]MAR08852.1 hypothetical protein [Blastopirellula sp.]|tara:strand:- start:1094 stop:1387 length:294 start_codon:yes stop_codon:yes gene_type:complete
MTGVEIVRALEQRSQSHPDRVVRLTGRLDDQSFELLIFRGFSSSTTHPTSFDPDASVLPEGTLLEQAELLQGPLNPAVESLLAGPMSPLELLGHVNW